MALHSLSCTKSGFGEHQSMCRQVSQLFQRYSTQRTQSHQTQCPSSLIYICLTPLLIYPYESSSPTLVYPYAYLPLCSKYPYPVSINFFREIGNSLHTFPFLNPLYRFAVFCQFTDDHRYAQEKYTAVRRTNVMCIEVLRG